MSIISNEKNIVFQSDDEHGIFCLRITKTYPIQIKLGRLEDFDSNSPESTSCNVSVLDLEEIKELIDQALTHFE